jgi:hypothetical protein
MAFFDFWNAKFALVCLVFMNFCFMLLRNLLIREFREVHVDFVLCKFVLLYFCVYKYMHSKCLSKCQDKTFYGFCAKHIHTLFLESKAGLVWFGIDLEW